MAVYENRIEVQILDRLKNQKSYNIYILSSIFFSKPMLHFFRKAKFIIQKKGRDYIKMQTSFLVNTIKKKKRTSIFRLRDQIQLFILCAPAVIFLFTFCYIPMAGLIVAFQDYRFDQGVFGSQWIGFKNFEFFFTSDTAWRITRNTILYNLAFIITGLFFYIGFALLLNEITKKIFIKVYQSIMFLPFFISWVIVAFLLYVFIRPELGFLTKILVGLGINPPDWYFDPKVWPFIFVVANLWKNLGYSTILYYTSIIGINQEYFEAASIDGATKLQSIIHITLPSLAPMISMLTLISIGRIFSANFDMFFNLPKDNGMLYSTIDVIDTYVYRALKVTGDTGMAIAAGFYQSVVGFILVLATNYILKKTSEENSVF